MNPRDRYLSEVRERAERKALDALRADVATRREVERMLRARNLGAPFDDLVGADLESLREKTPAKYAMLLRTSPEFAARVKFLEAEERAIRDAIKVSGDEAVLAAGMDLPPAVELSQRQYGEVERLLDRYGVRNPDELVSVAAQEEFRALEARHALETAHAKNGATKTANKTAPEAASRAAESATP